MKRSMHAVVCLVILLSAQNLFAQKSKNVIKGIVTDSVTGEPLPFATILVFDSEKLQSVTHADSNGRYILKNILPGCYSLITSYVGYKMHETSLNIKSNNYDSINNNIQLANKKVVMKEVLITAVKDKNWLCCCCGYSIMYCTNHRFNNDSIAPIAQTAPAKWYNLSIYPNPTTNRVNLTANLATEQPVQLEILDATGKLVLQQQLDFRNQGNYIFDLSAYSHGTYFFRMHYMGETHIEKVLKLR